MSFYIFIAFQHFVDTSADKIWNWLNTLRIIFIALRSPADVQSNSKGQTRQIISCTEKIHKGQITKIRILCCSQWNAVWQAGYSTAGA